MSTPKIRILRCAAETLGGKEALAKALGVSPEQVSNWLSGAEVARNGAYLAALDIVARSAAGIRPVVRRQPSKKR